MTSYIWKPSTVNSWKRAPVLLVPSDSSGGAPTITTPDGKTYTGKFINDNEGRKQYSFPAELVGMQNLKVSYGGQTGTIADGKVSYEGSSISGWDARAKGSLGSAGGFGGYDPSQVGQYGFAPANVEGLFPSPTFANFDSIQTAPYKFTNPFDFAKKFGEFNRTELRKNYDQSKEFGLEALDTELKGLQGFAPAAAALQRSEVALDNTFNQAERTRQIQGTLPEVPGQLTRQGERAETYATGKLPSSIEDRAYEVASRSRAADLSSAGGFGAQSSVARKTSDLMSAEQRLNLSKYGDQLLTSNIGTKAGLLLAPTEYANAGSQIRVMPTADAATRAAQLFGEINNQTLVSTTNALSNVTQQRQFQTNLEQQTRQFNASGNFAESQFNASAANTFALNKFSYQVGYAGAVAGAAQTDLNTQVAIQQQNDAKATFDDNKDATQNANNVGAAATIIGAIGSVIASNLGDSSNATPGSGEGPSATGTSIVDGSQGEAPVVSGPDTDFNQPVSDPMVDRPVDNTPSEEPLENVSPDVAVVGPPEPGSGEDSFRMSDTGTRALRLAQQARIPTTHVPQLQAFKQTVAGGLPPVVPLRTVKAMTVASDRTLKAAGLSRTPQKGYIQTGYGSDGKPVYSDKALAQNKSTEVGARDVRTISAVFEPFTAFTPTDKQNLDRLETLSDPEFINALDTIAAARDPQAFTDLLMRGVKNVTRLGVAKR